MPAAKSEEKMERPKLRDYMWAAMAHKALLHAARARWSECKQYAKSIVKEATPAQVSSSECMWEASKDL